MYIIYQLKLVITVGNNSPGRSAKVYPINNIQDSPLEL